MAKKNTKILGLDEILGSPLKLRTIEVPEWGGSIILREMSGRDREAFEEAVISMNGSDPQASKGNLRAWLISLAMVDEEGNRMFADGKDVAALGDTSSTALIDICEEIKEMNGIGDQEVDELVKDFGDGPSSDSTTG